MIAIAEKTVQEVVDAISPYMNKTIDDKIAVALAEKLGDKIDLIFNGKWDAWCEEQGNLANLPPEIIAQMKTFDDKIRKYASRLETFFTAIAACSAKLRSKFDASGTK